MTVESRLEEVFIAYLNLAKVELGPATTKPPSQRSIQLLETRSMELRRLVYGLEIRSEFRGIVKETLSAFPQKSSVEDRKDDLDDPSAPRETEIQNLFRRSRFYTTLHNGKLIDERKALSDLRKQFRKANVHSRYLLPLIGVTFPVEAIEFPRPPGWLDQKD